MRKDASPAASGEKAVEESINLPKSKSAARPTRTRGHRGAILLKSGSAQTWQTMGVIGALPGAELFFGELVAAAGFLESDLAALHGRDNRGLAADHPSFGVGRRQLTHGTCSDMSPIDNLIG